MKVKTDIELRLNPRARDAGMGEKHKFDLEIMSATDSIFEALSEDPPKGVRDQLRALQKSAQNLLKQEWEKSKGEALSGRGRTPPAG